MTIIVAHWDNPAAIREKAAKKMLQRWTHTAKCFGVTDIRFVEVDELPPHNDAEMNVTTYPTLNDALDGVDGEVLYVEQGGEPMGDLPKDAVFVFGSDFGGLPKADISLDTVHGLHADVACAIVLAEWSNQWR